MSHPKVSPAMACRSLPWPSRPNCLAPRTACPPHTARAWPGMSFQAHQPCPVPRPRTEAAGVQRPRDIPSPGGVGAGEHLSTDDSQGQWGPPQTPAQGRRRCPAGKPHAVSPPSSMRGSRPLRAPAMSGSKPPGTLLLPAPARLQPTLCPEREASLQPGTWLCPQHRGLEPTHLTRPQGPIRAMRLSPASSPLTRRHLSHCSRRSLWPLSPLPLTQGGPPHHLLQLCLASEPEPAPPAPPEPLQPEPSPRLHSPHPSRDAGPGQHRQASPGRRAA